MLRSPRHPGPWTSWTSATRPRFPQPRQPHPSLRSLCPSLCSSRFLLRQCRVHRNRVQLIDLKFRGYIVVSPSIHPDNVRRYTSSSNYHPLQTPLADLPAWLADLLMPAVDPSPAAPARPVVEEDAEA